MLRVIRAARSVFPLITLLLLCLFLSSCAEEPCRHTFGEGRVRRAPTCAEEGEMVYMCTQCRAVRTAPIEKGGHTPTTVAEENEHITSCTVCQTVLSRQEHSPADAPLSVTEATAPCTSAVHRLVCTVCAYVWEEPQVPKRLHTVTPSLDTATGRLTYTCSGCRGSYTVGGTARLYDFETPDTTLKNWSGASETAWYSYIGESGGNHFAVASTGELKTSDNGTNYFFRGPYAGGMSELTTVVFDFEVSARGGYGLVETSLHPKTVEGLWPGPILHITEWGAIYDVKGGIVAAAGTVNENTFTHITVVVDTTVGDITYYVGGVCLARVTSSSYAGVRLNYCNFIITGAISESVVGHGICFDRMALGSSFETNLSTEREEKTMKEYMERREEEELREQMSARVPSLKAKLSEFDLETDFGGTQITSMSTTEWSAPAVLPTVGQHPRLFFTEADLPSIRQSLKASPEKNRELRAMANKDIGYGVLPTARIRSNGVYNYDASILNIIQAKALYYQLTGIEYYGYEAILSMKNFIKTLGIGYFNSDQCRYFGNTVYIAACVYDWCYDLMTDADKLELQVGVENKLLKGNSGCYYVNAEGELLWCDGNTVPGGPKAQGNHAKMEIGFPPSHAGALFGHNSEYQLLRDYMSFAAAIYDEEPSWWQYCGGRFYEQYYPAREFFYSEESAIYPEGTACYGPWRFVCDMYSAWMIYSMTGENIYGDKLANVPKSFLAHETVGGAAFGTGDGGGQKVSSGWGSGALMVAYLCEDPVLYANAAYFGDGLNLTERVLLNGKNIAPADDRTEGFNSAQYNGGHYGQLIVRRSWQAEDADQPVVLMKGAGLGNGGHDHNDFGSFQIYYKGFLTTEDGVYDTWGSSHHFYYHVATAAHNSLLYYAPGFTPHSFYNGGQRHLMSNKPNGRPTLDGWLHEDFRMGEQTGLSVGYEKGDGERVRFAYYDNDLTSAYYSTVVKYYGRTMLVVYTGRTDVPMVMLVYDNHEGVNSWMAYEKHFLLQCVKEPIVDTESMTVTVVNGAGKLVLQNLTGALDIQSYGGTSGDAPQRFWLSGIDTSLPSGGGLSSGGSNNNAKAWGHVELEMQTGAEADQMLNLLYVTDADTTPSVPARYMENGDYVGAQVYDSVAIFPKSQTMCESALTFSSTGIGKQSYYVSRLAAGEWQVTVNGQSIGTFTVTEAEHLLTFSAVSGNVTVRPLS